MQPREVKTIDDAKKIVEHRGISHVKVGLHDIDGVLRGKYMSKNKFFSALDKGFGFCDVVLGWDVKDQLYDNVSHTGWHTGYPDATVNVIPESCRNIPGEEQGLLFLCEFDQSAQALCPRGTMRRVLNIADDMGFKVIAGLEYEFFLFRETSSSVREKNYHDLLPLAHDEFGYSVIRNSVDSDVYLDILELAEEMDFPLEGLHEETGPGVLEAAIACDEGIVSFDKAALFKTFVKVAAQKRGLMATFMAKWSEQYPGQSGHIHMSLRSRDSDTVFHNSANEYGMSDTMRHFVAGQQKMMPQVLALIAPTINSYRRLIPGFWAPTVASLGIDNRTCALRVIPGSAASQRIEYRVAAADANPYLAAAAALASGLWGVENRVEPDCITTGNAYEQSFSADLMLPNNLWDAAQRLKGSTMARDFLGDDFVDHYVASREWEVREFSKHITPWELDRYFEII